MKFNNLVVFCMFFPILVFFPHLFDSLPTPEPKEEQ